MNGVSGYLNYVSNNQQNNSQEIQNKSDTLTTSFPTLFDETGEVFRNYNISAFPTTFMIDKEGNIVGYVPGMMTKDIMINVINQTIEATE